LNERGLHLNAPLIEAAALLHDIARTSSDHARAGAELLGDLGYRRVAAVTVHHMDLQDEAEVETVPGEAEILYLADKLVSGTCVVALRERLAARLGELQAQPEGQTTRASGSSGRWRWPTAWSASSASRPRRSPAGRWRRAADGAAEAHRERSPGAGRLRPRRHAVRRRRGAGSRCR